MTSAQPPRRDGVDPAEELARVYADAEHALSVLLAREVARDLQRDGDGATETAARLAAVRTLRVAAQTAVRGLNGTVPPLVRQVLDESARSGTAAARSSLAQLLGQATDAEPFDRRRLDLLAAAVLDQVTPVHAAIVRTVPDVYRDVIRRSAPALLVGAQTRREAAQRAMLEFARRGGVTGFTDRAGRRWELASYVEMALRTVAARTATDAQVERLAVDGHHLVMVTDAPQECALCRPFEGRVLTTTGQPGVIRVEHAIRDGVMVEVNVVDTLDGARAKGFQHPNCRHTVKLYLPGVTKAPTGPGTGPDPKGDEARQRQRAIEREIRASKRRASLALDDEARKAANTRVREWQARMREHLAEHPELRRLTYREAPGVGNTPPIDLVERLGGETPFPDLPDDDSEVSTAATAQPAWDTRSADELRAAGERATDHYRRTVALTDAEQEALDNYTGAAGAELVYGADYSNINRGLRGQQPMGEIAAAASAALDSAAARYTTPERMTTWRSLRHWDVGQLTPGDVLDDPAWQSTSFRNEGFGGRTFLEITVPKGSHGIIVNGARGGGLTEEEQEFLLPRGTRYVVEAEEMRDGKRWIKVTAMPPMSQSPGGGQR